MKRPMDTEHHTSLAKRFAEVENSKSDEPEAKKLKAPVSCNASVSSSVGRTMKDIPFDEGESDSGSIHSMCTKGLG